ncbi:hypothetical protein KP509_08G004700 [Ceratopteris richardii]|uniref:thioredoxin-dependent peroxiredoxin n=1 Tax=Ceratopteris richardii TaxID=49495 RepID=A0A8T2UAG4_CERRI|nr:hypothetical protein KP509_08G004700 [Ceratopteris richardii]
MTIACCSLAASLSVSSLPSSDCMRSSSTRASLLSSFQIQRLRASRYLPLTPSIRSSHSRGGSLTIVSAASRSPPNNGEDRPLVGIQAPDFEAEAVLDHEFVKVKLSNYRGKKYVVLFFYPLDFTFVCPTEITAFSDRYEEFEKLNTEVLGISTDSVFSHLAWIQIDRRSGGLGELKYPLVADLTKTITRSYNVLIPSQGIGLRGLFIIDKDGIIQHVTINNLAIGRNVDEALRTLKAVQHVQEYPDEVCPAGWKPGDKTMKSDTKQSKEYFAAL